MSDAATAEPPAPPSLDDGARLSAERPFPGLRPFGFADRTFFFGREKQTFALYRMVENGRFIAVIGSSGSGKSSLVLAGLQGLLADETADEGGPSWAFLDMRPEAAPLSRLATALSRLSPKDSPDESARRRDRVEWALRQSSFSLESAIDQAGGLGGHALLLVVDQFEELFRYGLAGLALRKPSVEEVRARDEATQFVQILLDADRRRLKDVHVLITMRSDFIGDCAYFHGLSEAVSATQYLVPNLTRSQMEDVIRKPVELVGASIEPELVERLINDCGDELDQLPVLQHCLMRLWDRAGASPERPRRLTRKTYDDVGRMTEALSRHADEVLAQCGGRDLAAEQAFRALSELDRDGRATRRPLRFDALLAESGAAESDLRVVLDRFRAPGCSFVVPPLAAAPKLASDDRIDTGHETLLRRWRMLAGDPASVDPRTGRPAPGWLAEEQADGQRYRTLLSLLGDTPGDENATLKDPSGTKAWWDSLPRTPSWAERYGGRFDAVRSLIAEAIAARLHAQWINGLAVAGCVALVIGLPVWAVEARIKRQRQEAEAVLKQQEANERGAMGSAQTMLTKVRGAFNSGTLNLDGAKSLAVVSEGFLRDLRKTQTSHAADSIWVEALNVESDLQSNAGNVERQLILTKEAKDAIEPLSADAPADGALRKTLYDSRLRYGSALAAFPKDKDKMQLALDAFRSALPVVVELAKQSDSGAAQGLICDTHLKIGDVLKMTGGYDEAFKEYRAGLGVAEAAVKTFPDSPDALRNRANAHFRIAEAMREQDPAAPGAESEYKLAEKDQLALIGMGQNTSDVRSNLASTYSKLGRLAHAQKQNELALTWLKQALTLQDALIKSDSTNPSWMVYAAPNYDETTSVLDDLSRPNESYRYLQKAYDLRKDLTIRDQARIAWQMAFATTAKTLGDRSRGVPQIEAYRDTIRAWKRAANATQPPDAVKKRGDDAFTIAEVFADAKDWRDAQQAFWLVKVIADLNLKDDPTNAVWQDQSDRAKEAAQNAGQQATADAAADDAPAN